MKTFNRYLVDQKVANLEIQMTLDENVETFDASFIKRATKVTSFNLEAADFQTLNYKREIQYLFKTYLFPDFDLSKTINGFDADRFNAVVDELKRVNNRNLMKLHKYNLKGVGPGEVLMYFIINDAIIGGGSSAGLDLTVGNEDYEIKSVNEHSKGYLYGFKLGGTFDLSDIQKDLIALGEKYKKEAGINKKSEISTGPIGKLADLDPVAFSDIERRYKELAYNEYFSKHPIIFMHNAGGAKKMGKVIAVKHVQLNEIAIDALTSGTIKPKVWLSAQRR